VIEPGVVPYLLGGISALMVGLSKTGLPGFSMLFVPLMAQVFDAKLSVGATLGLLLVGDVFAVRKYRQHTQWKHLWGLFPFVAAGMIPAYGLLRFIEGPQLRVGLGALVLALLGLEVWRRQAQWTRFPHTAWFAAMTGFLAGFSTTMGNVAGPVMSVFLISRGLPKNEFMGTSAWFFFLVNLSKVPFYAGYTGMITAGTLWFNLWMAPVVAAGAVVGIWLLPRIPQKIFDASVLGLSALAALKLVFS